MHGSVITKRAGSIKTIQCCTKGTSELVLLNKNNISFKTFLNYCKRFFSIRSNTTIVVSSAIVGRQNLFLGFDQSGFNSKMIRSKTLGKQREVCTLFLQIFNSNNNIILCTDISYIK